MNKNNNLLSFLVMVIMLIALYHIIKGIIRCFKTETVEVFVFGMGDLND